MKLCVGTSKGIVILDCDRGATPVMVLAEPSAIWCMANSSSDPGLIYAGSNSFMNGGRGPRGRGALARSKDGGRSWSDITPNLGIDEDVWALGVPPDRAGSVFVGTSQARLFRSDDQGATFRECAGFTKIPGRDRWSFPAPPHIPHVRSIAFAPTNPAIIYVGVEEGGVVLSRDAGETFEVVNRGIYPDIHTIVVSPGDHRRLFATTGAGFYLSENAGSSWRHITNGLSRSYTIPLLVSGDGAQTILTAAAAGPPPSWMGKSRGANALVFRSDDGGRSFRALGGSEGPTRGMVMRMKPDPSGDGGFFAALNDGGVIHSADGVSISTLAEKLPPAYDLVAIP
jgi:photosystem II stability/assembly factor-like uncharacterized protein